MASPPPLLLLLLLLLFFLTSATPLAAAASSSSSPYLSPSIFFQNYQNMLKTFKIFTYNQTSPTPPSFKTSAESLFHSSLARSSFVTDNPDEALLFYFHFPPAASPRSISGAIKDLQLKFPFWGRSLGADHFYLSCDGVRLGSHRTLVELKKNSVQISCFEGGGGEFRFVPHKDVALPPRLGGAELVEITRVGFLDGQEIVLYSRDLNSDSEFVRKTENGTRDQVLSRSKFCLFVRGSGISNIGEALRYGCLPVVIVDGPIMDLPFADVLRWTEIAVFVRSVEEAKTVMREMCLERFEKMTEMGTAVSKHFEWSLEDPPQPYDAFHMIMYQLWLRRHTIRYRQREAV